MSILLSPLNCWLRSLINFNLFVSFYLINAIEWFFSASIASSRFYKSNFIFISQTRQFLSILHILSNFLVLFSLSNCSWLLIFHYCFRWISNFTIRGFRAVQIQNLHHEALWRRISFQLTVKFSSSSHFSSFHKSAFILSQVCKNSFKFKISILDSYVIFFIKCPINWREKMLKDLWLLNSLFIKK